jgi:hypothetical protein
VETDQGDRRLFLSRAIDGAWFDEGDAVATSIKIVCAAGGR